MRTRLYYSAMLVLAIGLASAVAIYLTAEDEPKPASGFGGKAAVLFDELNRWFAGLWRGKSLATTVAWLSVFAALVLFGVARHLPPDSKDR